MEKISYLGQPNCFRLSNGTVEALVSTDIGRRILGDEQTLDAAISPLIAELNLGTDKREDAQ